MGTAVTDLALAPLPTRYARLVKIEHTVFALPFAYVGAFKAHVNVGFFCGAQLPDPAGLLEGSGKRMRHVKLTPDEEPDAAALGALIDAAYRDIKARLAAERAAANE